MKMEFRKQIFKLKSKEEFDVLAFDIFKYQIYNNDVYNEYVKALGISPSSIKSAPQIPFLPADLFKDHKVVTGTGGNRTVFESSGTAGTNISRHYVSDITIYEESFINGFRYFYGEPSGYFFAALLPSYSERQNSSLIYMLDQLIKRSEFPGSGFYNNDPQELIRKLEKVRNDGQKGILLGVSYALMDLAEKFSPDLSGLIVVETGGMKGRRKEITRQELHSVLKAGFNVETIHSEYGMTELLSQAWSKGNGIFYCPPWMRISIRDPQDPLTIFDKPGRTGGINIIDLANINSCSFLMINDLGKLHEDGGFEVLGRLDYSDIRGCNLMVE
jgi:phenylacetate-coenzyme A ligase PaaK-like adenylate-forming protein